MENKKTKVIAFRVTKEEYEALYFAAAQKQLKVAELVYAMVNTSIPEAYAALAKERKRLELKAKRDAKKAEKNGL
jgi:uncharacterized protein (DUF1778 family)